MEERDAQKKRQKRPSRSRSTILSIDRIRTKSRSHNRRPHRKTIDETNAPKCRTKLIRVGIMGGTIGSVVSDTAEILTRRGQITSNKRSQSQFEEKTIPIFGHKDKEQSSFTGPIDPSGFPMVDVKPPVEGGNAQRIITVGNAENIYLGSVDSKINKSTEVQESSCQLEKQISSPSSIGSFFSTATSVSTETNDSDANRVPFRNTTACSPCNPTHQGERDRIMQLENGHDNHESKSSRLISADPNLYSFFHSNVDSHFVAFANPKSLQSRLNHMQYIIQSLLKKSQSLDEENKLLGKQNSDLKKRIENWRSEIRRINPTWRI